VCAYLRGLADIVERKKVVNKIQAFVVRLAAFLNEVGIELKKSAWPTRSELVDSTIVVILSVMALGVFVGISDIVLMRVLKWIL
jgi:preprotein translocase subunit SecE